MNQHSKHIKLAEIEIPENLWELDMGERVGIAMAVKAFMEKLLRKQLGPHWDKKEHLLQLIDSTIIVNEAEERYQICQVMKDIKQIINEPVG